MIGADGGATPATIFGPNLTLWLRASKGVTTGGGLLTRWNDQSGNAHDVQPSVPGAGPGINPAGINGHTTVTYAALVNTILSAIGVWTMADLIAIGAWTVAYVWTYTGAHNMANNGTDPVVISFLENSPPGLAWGAGQDPGNALNSEGGVTAWDSPPGAFEGLATASNPKANPHYCISTYTGGSKTLTLALDGAVDLSRVLTTSVDPTGNHLAIGANARSVGTQYDGEIGEIVVANTPASAGQKTALGKWFHGEWGI